LIRPSAGRQIHHPSNLINFSAASTETKDEKGDLCLRRNRLKAIHHIIDPNVSLNPYFHQEINRFREGKIQQFGSFPKGNSSPFVRLSHIKLKTHPREFSDGACFFNFFCSSDLVHRPIYFLRNPDRFNLHDSLSSSSFEN